MSTQPAKSPREMDDAEFVALLGATLPKPPVSGGGK